MKATANRVLADRRRRCSFTGAAQAGP